jgi:hypothetical protein
MAVVQQGQNLMDMAIMHCGDAEALFDLALANKLSPTSEVAPGTDLGIPAAVNAGMVNYLANKNETVATNNDYNKFKKPEGIGYWIIGDDFTVS